MNKEKWYWVWKNTIIDFDNITDEKADYDFEYMSKKDYVFHFLGCPDKGIHEWYNGGCRFTDKNLPKSSPNIIDLIEIGDYVNGIKVDFTNIKDKLSYEDKCIGFYDGDGDIFLFENDIKSILTKEQFESMEYKIGE